MPTTSDQPIVCPACRTKQDIAPGLTGQDEYAGICISCGFYMKLRLQQGASDGVTFTVNGTQCTVGDKFSPTLSLNEYLRRTGVSRGTKQMCTEGGCGVCLVAVKLYEPVSATKQVYAVNSCLVPLHMCDGWEITTIEGLGNPRTGLHAIQKRLTKYNGAQCGFCSPAQIINMYSLLQRNPTPTMQQVEDVFDTSICRCTGYRSIMDAMKSFASDAPSNLQGGMIDIEDLNPKVCKKSGKRCEGKCDNKSDKERCSREQNDLPFTNVGDTVQWLKPTTLQELYSLLHQHRTDKYSLVFGNTGRGVFRELGPWMFNILIDIRGIQELYRIEFTPSLVWGANLTLTNIHDLCDKARSNTSLPYAAVFAEHIKKVANNGVRNLASWAGNLMLKHKHSEFLSDLYVMLDVVGARLLIGDDTGNRSQCTLKEFLSLDMQGKVIEAAFLPTYTDNNNYIRLYRVSQRNQDDHGHVAAGFNMKLDKTTNCTVLQRPTIVFQGVSNTMNRAENTEAFLEGKQLGDPQVLKDCLNMLSMEISPVTDPTLQYRRSVAMSLFYKYVLDVCGDKVAQKYRSGGASLERPVSSGTQSFDTRKEQWPLSQPITSMDADYLVSAKVRYLDDLPWDPDELHAAFVISTEGNAEIASVDAQAALAMPGVYKFIQASDIPAGGVNNFSPLASTHEEFLSSGRVEYAGQPIGIIVADDPLTARSAASRVKVTYTNVQPPLVDTRTAINQKSFFPSQLDPVIRGDPDTAIAQSPRRLSGSVEVGDQYHFHLEAQSSRCAPNDNGGMDVRSTTQFIDRTTQAVAGLLNIPVNSVNLEIERLGGAFGGKITRNSLVAGACALAALIMQRPVRLVMDIHTNMKTMGKRLPVIGDYEVGFTEEGKLNGIKFTYYADCGHHDIDSGNVFVYKFIDNAYFCPNWNLKIVNVKTNKATNTALRAPEAVACVYMMETILEHIAKVLNKDPTEIKKLNLYQKGQFSLNGTKLDYCNLTEIVSQVETSSDFEARKRQVAEFNQVNRWRKRGISLIPARYGVAWTNGNYSVFVAVYHADGSVTVEHGGIDLGHGINTKVAQVCAYELGIPLSLVRVKKSSSNVNANSFLTAGSKTTEMNCQGVIQCCQEINARMSPVRQRMPTAAWKDIVAECHRLRIDLVAHAFTVPQSLYPCRYDVYMAAVAEAELDVLTGQFQINRVDILYDCGDSMNPEIDVGQIEGGFVLGMGCHLTEFTKFDPKTGVLLTDGTWLYKPPLPKDVPIDFRVSLLKNAPNPVGVLRSKTVGEPPVPMSCCTVFAIKHAVEAARAEIGQDTYFTLNSPALLQQVQAACQVDPAQFTLGN